MLLTERNPKLSKFGGFYKGIESNRGAAIIRNIAS